MFLAALVAVGLAPPAANAGNGAPTGQVWVACCSGAIDPFEDA